jgi:serine/threonine protein kinase
MTDVDLGIEGIGPASPIGSGDAGVVYRARQEALNRTVAVKVLRAGPGDEHARDRFEEECRAVSALARHPHVVALYDAGMTSSGRPYLTMEYLPRGSLAERLARDGPLGPDEVVDLGIKVAGALESAHRVGLVHGRLTPENVMLAASGEPQVADFCKSPLDPSSLAGPAPAHGAPEVFAGHAADARADVYSLGSILCALLAEAAPFELPEAESFHPLLDRVFIEDVSDLRPPGVPGELWEVIERALADDREVRTPSAAVLVGELEDVRKLRGARPAAPPGRRRPPLPDGAGPVAAAGSRVRVAGTAVVVAVAVAIGAVALTRPDERSRPTSLSASDLPVSTTLFRPERGANLAPFAAPFVSTTQPPFDLPRPQIVEPPPRVTATTPVPRTSVPTTTATPPPTVAPTTVTPPPPPPPPPPPKPTTVTGVVIGCDSFGQRCDDIPIHGALPPPDTDPRAVSTLAKVTQGTEMRARCWAEGARTYNYDASAEPPDLGPDPYDSDVYFNVQVLGETWGWISDTSFVRDKGLKLGLPRC